MSKYSLQCGENRTVSIWLWKTEREMMATWEPASRSLPVNPATRDVPVNVPINERQQWFLDQLWQNIHCGPADIAAKWDVVLKTAKRDIAELRKKDLIIFVGPPKDRVVPIEIISPQWSGLNTCTLNLSQYVPVQPAQTRKGMARPALKEMYKGSGGYTVFI